MRVTMKHPEHGEKLVYLDDIKQHRDDGWTEIDAPSHEAKEVDIPKKRGRPAKDK